MIRIILILLFKIPFVIVVSQNPVNTIKVVKEYPVATDSAFFDPWEFALYSKSSGYENRFNTLKQCTLTYTSKHKSGSIVLRKNKVSKDIRSISNSRSRKTEFKFTNIILKADSLHAMERKCPSLTVTFYKMREFRWRFGTRFWIPSPIPAYRPIGPPAITWSE